MKTPLRITVANQKGGVGKTTTVLTLGRCFADEGCNVLLIDTDPQGNLWTTLNGQEQFQNGGQPRGWVHQLFEDNPLAATQIATPVHEKVSVIFSNRSMFMAESRLAAIPAKEMILNSLLSVAEQHFDVILIDVAPSISHIQSCAFAYTRKLLIPVGMDNLSIGGALSSLQTMDWLNKMLQLGCGCVGFLPTMLDHRLSATEVVLHNLSEMAQERGIAMLPGIRTDQAINRSMRAGEFLQDFDQRSKALEDYRKVCKILLNGVSTVA
jgi:chromosome partitioning protein